MRTVSHENIFSKTNTISLSESHGNIKNGKKLGSTKSESFNNKFNANLENGNISQM